MGAGITILCVDDDPSVLMLRKALLESCGYNVFAAQSGQEGIEYFEVSDVDLVLLDYQMPGMTGDCVAQTMRKIKPHVPIIMLTAFVSVPPEALVCTDALLTKGQPPVEILEKIKEVLASSQLCSPAPNAARRQPVRAEILPEQAVVRSAGA